MDPIPTRQSSAHRARRHRLAFAGAVLAVLTNAWVGSGRAAPTVVAPAGVIAGSSQGEAETFLGIPYARPPVGLRRWRPSVRAPSATHPIKAVAPHGGCAALISGDAFETLNEDCLYLNVYRPRGTPDDARLPVTVFVHGGGNQSGTPEIYDGSAFATATRSIVVIPAYRLGVFGFLALPGAQRAGGPSGDLAAGDLLNALRWVRANIASFGGDGGTVTLAGESAGAADVCDLLTMPASRGLFGQAIMESGFCPVRPTLAVMQAIGAATATDAGCTGPHALACLRGKPVKTLLESWGRAWNAPSLHLADGQDVPRPLFPMTPYGTALQPLPPGDAIRQGKWHAVPVLVGFNRDEIRSFLAGYYPLSRERYTAILARAYGELKDDLSHLYPLTDDASPLDTLAAIRSDQMFICPALRAAATLATRTATSVYEFADRTAPAFHSLAMKLPEPAGFDRGASHTAELPYLFGYKSVIGPLSPEQTALSRKMMAMWATFDRPGSTWPRWTPDNPVVTVIADSATGGIRNRNDVGRMHHCDFWEKHPQTPLTLFP